MSPVRLCVPLLAVAFFACDSGTTAQNAPPKPSADTGTAPPTDSGANNGSQDSGAVDTGGGGLTIEDTGTGQPPPRRDGSTNMPGPVCMELEGCCPELPQQGQGPCNNSVANGDEGGCQQALDLAKRAGFCLPMGFDAGSRDAGPLGPVCTEYLACCPELGPIQGACERTAMAGDEMRCQMSIDLARQFGMRCLPMDAGVIDAGTATTTPDAGMMMSMDAGTATTASDAGLVDASTSTTSDAG